MAKAPRPLSPWLYLRRSPRRVLPLLGVQALVTALLIAIITPTNAFRATSEAYAVALDHLTIVSPMRRHEFDDELRGLLDGNPAMAEHFEAKMFWMQTPMIVGKSFAPLIAVPEARRDALLERMGLRLVAGRLPQSGKGEAAVHGSILDARGLAIGDAFGRLVDPTHSTPGRFEVVGRLEGDSRMGLVDFTFASQPLSVLARTPPFEVVYAKDARKAESDAYLRAIQDAEAHAALRIVDATFVREQIDDHLSNLPVVLGFITVSVALVVALVTGLLAVIAFQTRVDEFGMHLAVGQRRATLVKKLAAETFLVALAGWAAGLVLGTGAVWLYRDQVLAPKGILMNVPDVRPMVLSLTVPVLSTLVASVAVARQLRRMDPVAVIQRRGV